MDTLILRSFMPEFFICIAIFLQLTFNVRLINRLSFNFPIINNEMFIQTFFILFCILLLFFNLQIEGFFSNFLFLNDEGSKIIKMIFILSCLLITVFVFRAFSTQKLNLFEFFLIFFFSILSSLLLISSFDLLSVYLTIEMQALCFYILASFKKDSAFSTEAGLKYFLLGSFISCIFLLGASLIYGSLGTLNFNAIGLILSFSLEGDLNFLNFFLIIGVTLIIATLLFKISAAPFHFWSPDVYEGAPLSATIIFTVLPKLVIVTLLIRWIFAISLFYFKIKYIFIVCGILSLFVGTFFALNQKRVKRLVIYSSIAQIAFIVAAFSSNTLDSFSSIIFFLIVYMVSSILIWGHIIFLNRCQNLLNSFYNRTITNVLFLSSFSNNFYYNKLWAFSFILIFFSIAGIPPFVGFLAKFYIFLGLIESNQIFFSILLILISVISVFYYIRIIKIIFFEGIKSNNLNNKMFALISKDYFFDLDCFIFSFLMLFLIFFFFYPTNLILISQYIVLNLLGF